MLDVEWIECGCGFAGNTLTFSLLSQLLIKAMVKEMQHLSSSEYRLSSAWSYLGRDLSISLLSTAPSVLATTFLAPFSSNLSTILLW